MLELDLEWEEHEVEIGACKKEQSKWLGRKNLSRRPKSYNRKGVRFPRLQRY